MWELGLVIAKLAHYLLTDPPKKYQQLCDHWLDDRDIIVLPFSEVDAPDLPAMDREPETPYDYDQESVEQFLSMIRNETCRADYRLLIERTQKITMTMLKRGVRQCVEATHSLLQGQGFAWGLVPKKSSEWIGTYAQKFLTSQPTETFTHSSDSITSGWGGTSDISGLVSSDLVIFDDAMYSGQQAQTIISSLQLQLEYTSRE